MKFVKMRKGVNVFKTRRCEATTNKTIGGEWGELMPEVYWYEHEGGGTSEEAIPRPPKYGEYDIRLREPINGNRWIYISSDYYDEISALEQLARCAE